MISIILTAYKEEKTIGRAIESILKNKLQNYELLVLAPDKETIDIAEKYSKTNKNIKIIQDPGHGKPNALNLAFKKARGDILILTDGDVYISENAIQFVLEKFKNPKIGAVTGRPVSINDRKTMFGFWAYVLSDIAHKRRLKSLIIRKRMFCSGYLYAFRKGIIEKIPTETLSEDGFISHLIYSKHYEITYSPESKVYVKYPDNFKDWINQKKRSVGGYNQIKKWLGKEIRSFRKESLGIFDVLKYPSNLREWFYIFALILARIYLWILIFIDVNIKKKKLKTIWVRTNSTK